MRARVPDRFLAGLHCVVTINAVIRRLIVNATDSWGMLKLACNSSKKSLQLNLSKN
jgi:hypothetical protein